MKGFSQKAFYDQYNGYNKYTQKWSGFKINRITLSHDLKQLSARLELTHFMIQNIAEYHQLSAQRTPCDKH